MQMVFEGGSESPFLKAELGGVMPGAASAMFAHGAVPDFI